MGTPIYYYNNIPIFSGICPSPFLLWNQENISYGNRWGAKTSLQLIGELTGLCNDFEEFVDRQDLLLSRFTQDFKSFEIREDNISIYNKPYAVIKSIDFESSNYVGIVPFTINLDVYDTSYWSGSYGVLNPKDDIKFEETTEGFLNITRTISAQGFNTSNKALDNAKNWVIERTGWKNQIVPSLINTYYGISPCLATFEENINRLTANYSVTENYTVDTKRPAGPIVRYTTDVSSGIDDGINQVSVQGNITTCVNNTIQQMRNAYYGLNIYSIAVNGYRDATNQVNLNPFYISSGIEEDFYGKSLSFNIVFNDDQSPNVWVDYSVTMEKVILENEITVRIDATIQGKGPLALRYTNVKNYFNNNFNGFVLATAQYQASEFFSTALNRNPISESVTYSENQGEINYSATWSTKKQNVNNVQDIDYTVTVRPAIQQYSTVPSLSCNGTYWIFDLGLINRQEVSVNGNLTVERGINVNVGINTAQQIVNTIRNKYCIGSNLILTNDSLTTGRESNSNVSWDVSWSLDANEMVV